MEDRSWMYTGHKGRGDYSMEWIEKTEQFVDHVFSRAGNDGVPCPCHFCGNTRPQTRMTMIAHLCKYGFRPDYTVWVYHGEEQPTRSEVLRQRTDDYEFGNDRMNDMVDDIRDAHGPPSEEEPEPVARAFFQMLSAAALPLHEHTEISLLDAITRLLAVKSQFSTSIACFDAFLSVFCTLLPHGHKLPRNLYEAKKLLSALSMPYEKIDACPNNCMLFRKQNEHKNYCDKCGESRYVEVEASDGQKRQLTVAKKVLRYLPIIPRIQRLYISERSAKQMTWHKYGHRYHEGKLVHPSDGEAWKQFDRDFPQFAAEPRNVRVAIATDGFNPFGMGAAPYSCWPVFVIPLNLPPGVIMQKHNIFLSLVIPGYPGKNMSVFMQPLVDDLNLAFEQGILTYDRASKNNFIMRVTYIFSIHDLPAYGLFCGWCVHGMMPCPVCMHRIKCIWLKYGRKYSFSSRGRTGSSSTTVQPARQSIPDSNQDEADMEDDPVEEELFSRGPSRLPLAPTRDEDKPIITPLGDTQWIEEKIEGRLPNGILGLLVRDKFPGLVTYEGRLEPAFTWEHYITVADPVADPEKRLNNLLERVEEDFWLYFRWADGTEHHARRVVHNVTKDLIPRMFYEGRIQAVINYYRNVKRQKIKRSRACRTYLTVEQYMEGKVWWAMKCPQAWRRIAELRWCKDEWKALSCEGRKRKEKMPAPAHYQGSASMPRFRRKLEKEEKRPVSQLEAYAIGKRVDIEGRECNPNTRDNLVAYKDAALELHGPEFNWLKEPIDGVAVHKAGGGKKHGRFMLGNGFLDTESVLSDVRSLRKGTADDVRPARQPWAPQENSTLVQQLRQELQEVREGRQSDRSYYDSELQALRAQFNAAIRNLVPPQRLETSASETAHIVHDPANDVLPGHGTPAEDHIDESSPVMP